MSGLILSALFFGEQLTARLWLGLFAVATGISLAAKPARSDADLTPLG
jgi:drug/metabolite transporter (DMT)-like permease